MKLLDLLNDIDKSKQNSSEFDVEAVSNFFEIYELPWFAQHEFGFQSYYTQNHLCTDTWVGSEAVYYQDELVFMIGKGARKASSIIHWVSVEKMEIVRKAFLDILETLRDDPEPTNIDILDMNLDLETNYYQVDYCNEILSNHKLIIIETNLPVLVISNKIDYSKPVSEWKQITVKHLSSDKKDQIEIIPLNKIGILYHTQSNKKFYDKFL